jgi:hypothetical protein
MKQLLLYFLFFVCAAFILVQCARYFPTDSKVLKHRAKGGKMENPLQNKSSSAQSSNSNEVQHGSSLKKSAFNLYFNHRAFPLMMLKYVNHYQFLSFQYWWTSDNKNNNWQLFPNPYAGFTFSGLLNTNDSSLVASNPIDEPK